MEKIKREPVNQIPLTGIRVCLDGEPSIIPCSYDNGSWYEYGSYASYIPPVTHWKFFDDKKPEIFNPPPLIII